MLPSSLYRVVHQTPTIEAYRHLRQASGLSPKALEAAERGLPNSLFSVQVLCDGEPVAMGRVIGDGGCFYQVVDIAVCQHIRAVVWARLSWVRSQAT